MHRLTKRRLATLALATYWVSLAVVTHVPKAPVPVEVSDKLLHLLAYGLLAALTAWCWSTFRPMTLWAYLTLLTAGGAYGALDELLQIPVGRHAELADWVADLAGFALGLALFAAGEAVFRHDVPRRAS